MDYLNSIWVIGGSSTTEPNTNDQGVVNQQPRLWAISSPDSEHNNTYNGSQSSDNRNNTLQEVEAVIHEVEEVIERAHESELLDLIDTSSTVHTITESIRPNAHTDYFNSLWAMDGGNSTAGTNNNGQGVINQDYEHQNTLDSEHNSSTSNNGCQSTSYQNNNQLQEVGAMIESAHESDLSDLNDGLPVYGQLFPHWKTPSAPPITTESIQSSAHTDYLNRIWTIGGSNTNYGQRVMNQDNEPQNTSDNEHNRDAPPLYEQLFPHGYTPSPANRSCYTGTG